MALATLTLLSCSFAPTPLLPRPAPSRAVLSRRASAAALVMVTKDAPTGLLQQPKQEQVTPWQLTADGLKFVDEELGTGPGLEEPGSVVSVHYTVSFAVSGETLGTTRGTPTLTPTSTRTLTLTLCLTLTLTLTLTRYDARQVAADLRAEQARRAALQRRRAGHARGRQAAAVRARLEDPTVPGGQRAAG